MTRLNTTVAIPLLLVFAFAQSALACQDPEPQQEQRPPTAAAGRFPRPGEAEHEIKPYDKVITKDAKSQAGVFKIHQIKEKIYYEIPAAQLGKDFLWVSQIARTTLGVGYGGQFLGDRVVRWDRYENRVLLKSVSYEVVADDKLPISRAVHAANNDAIMMAFYIEALAPDGSPVIEVTRLFTTEVTEFSPRARLRARMFDTTRSFVDRVVAYPQNVEVEATQTFSSPVEPPSATATPTPPSPFLGAGMRPGSATVLMHYSMVKLPDNPMMPRLEDRRVGYFGVGQFDYGRDEHRAPERRYIARWRLEKKDRDAALSEPIKPIVYYLDPATPEKWRPYLKKGVEDWNIAFEAAGFKNAVICKDAPTKEEDPNWSPEDVRYSVIRWLPSTIENASGPHISDPRTGEILNADIQFYQNVLKLARDWYFLQVGPLDSRARKLPLPDDLEGRLIEYVICHEVGHTLGFPHNMKASAEYPADKIGDPDWAKKMGHTPSIMDYSRFNYVAQPENHIDPADLVPRVGPYDIYATMWGYKPIPGARTPDDEKKTLDEWARQQDHTPWLRFSTPNSLGSDPGENTEAVGDADAVRSTGLGLKNLERVSDMLIPATTGPDKSYEDLADIYGQMLGQWVLELNHVTAIVGGVDSQEKYGSQDGAIFTPVAKDRQAAAVRFLNEHAFTTPKWALKPEVLERIEPSGALDRVRTAQQRVLTNLLSEPRIGRLIEQEAMDSKSAYAPSEFLAAVRKGIWSELDGVKVHTDAFRSNVQYVYLDLMGNKLNGRQTPSDIERSLIRSELRTLSQDILRALPRAADRETRAHLEDARDQIARALDPKFLPPAPQPGLRFVFPGVGGGTADSDAIDPLRVDAPLDCWPDYSIRLPIRPR
jgi:hypothetical protein